MLKQITIVGSGSWATALVKLFTEKGIRVFWHLEDREKAEFIQWNGYNPRYLSHVSLKKELIFPMTETSLVFRNSKLVIFAIPSACLEDTLNQIDPYFLEGKQLAVSINGLIPNSGSTPSFFVSKHIGIDANRIMVLGGPCYAEEIALQRNTYITISAENSVWVNDVCQSLESDYLHTVANYDPAGIEYVSIIKNIVGIATGIADGLNYGDNFQAVLVSNAMRETSQFLGTIDDRPRDLFHSAYFGDLLLTAYSDYNLNRTLGKLIGKGIQVNTAIHAMEKTAEGFHASREMAPLYNKSDLNMPIIDAVHRILHQQSNPFHEFKLLEGQLN